MRFLRPVLAVVVAYAVMAVLGMALFAALAFVLGTDRLFQPGTFRSAAIVNAAAIVIGAIISVVAGMFCRRIARSPRPAIVLAALVVILGAFSAVGNARKPDPGPRPADMPLLEAVSRGKEPDWLALLNPALGAAGVLLGARLARRADPLPVA